MKNIRNSPAFKFLIFLLIGFAADNIMQFNFQSTIIFAICFIAIAILAFFFSKNLNNSESFIEYENIEKANFYKDNSLSKIKTFGDLFFIISFASIGIATGIIISYQARSDYSINDEIVGKDFKGNFSGTAIKIMNENPKFSRILAKGDIQLQNFDELKNQTIYLTIFKQPWDNLRINNGDGITCIIKFKYPRSANLPQEFDEQNYLKYLDADFSATCSATTFHFRSRNYTIPIRERVLDAIHKNINKMFSKNTAGIASALTIGDKSDISKEIRNNFSITGTAHILAVSGLHVGIIAGVIFWLFSFIKNDWLKFIFVLLSLGAYLYLIYFPASAVRAGLMIALYLFAKTIQRPATPLNIVSCTAIFLLIISPKMAWNTGFQMSMGAILGITIFFEPIRKFFKLIFKKENSINKFLISSLAMTFSSSIVVSPIVAYYFNIFSIISPLANLVAIPMMVGAQMLTLLSIVLSFIYLPFAQLIANSSQLLIELSEILTNFAAKLPYSHLKGESVIALSIFISLFLVYLFYSSSKRQMIFRIVISSICMLMILQIFPERANTMQYFQREQFEMLQIRRNEARTDFVIISNFSNRDNLKKDYGLFNYLNKYPDSSYIFIDKLIYDKTLNFVKNNKIKFIFVENQTLKNKFFKNF